MSPLSVPNVSPIGARIRVLFRILQSVRKEEVEEETKKKNPDFGRSYLGNGWSDFLQIWNVDSLPSRHFCSNFGFNRIRNHGATKV